MVPKSENENKKQFWSILELVAKNNCVDMLESIVAMPADMVKIFFILTRSLGLYATLLLAPAEGWVLELSHPIDRALQAKRRRKKW